VCPSGNTNQNPTGADAIGVDPTGLGLITGGVPRSTPTRCRQIVGCRLVNLLADHVSVKLRASSWSRSPVPQHVPVAVRERLSVRVLIDVEVRSRRPAFRGPPVRAESPPHHIQPDQGDPRRREQVAAAARDYRHVVHRWDGARARPTRDCESGESSLDAGHMATARIRARSPFSAPGSGRMFEPLASIAVRSG
jgi:hypothetical protein